MIPLSIILDGDNAWPDLKSAARINVHHRAIRPASLFYHLGNEAPPVQVAVLTGATTSGRPSVAIRIDLPDGHAVIAETTARLFCMAAKVIMARYPDLFEGE